MGDILKASCEKCGFEEEVFFGSGMDNFFSVLNVPAINSNSAEFVVENIIERDKLDENLIFYNDKSMYKGEMPKNPIEWRGLKLNPKNNLCPKCIRFSLMFENVGDFD